MSLPVIVAELTELFNSTLLYDTLTAARPQKLVDIIGFIDSLPEQDFRVLEVRRVAVLIHFVKTL